MGSITMSQLNLCSKTYSLLLRSLTSMAWAPGTLMWLFMVRRQYILLNVLVCSNIALIIQLMLLLFITLYYNL